MEEEELTRGRLWAGGWVSGWVEEEGGEGTYVAGAAATTAGRAEVGGWVGGGALLSMGRPTESLRRLRRPPPPPPPIPALIVSAFTSSQLRTSSAGCGGGSGWVGGWMGGWDERKGLFLDADHTSGAARYAYSSHPPTHLHVPGATAASHQRSPGPPGLPSSYYHRR